MTDVTENTISARLRDVQTRIAAACERSGRHPDDITLVAVSKTFPLVDVEEAHAAGLTHFGENRAQELTDKAERLPGVGSGGSVQWHMVGHLQRNKARDVVENADVLHSLDSPRLAKEVNKRARKAGRVIPCFVQVNVAEDENKYGITPEKTHQYLDSVAKYDHLFVRGLMTIVPHYDDPEDARPHFRELRELLASYDPSRHADGALTELSMGMTNDFEVALEEGATYVRIGSAIFGARDYG